MNYKENKIKATMNDHKVVVDFEHEIGIYFKNKKHIGPTNYGIVHSSKNGSHIVPANPIKENTPIIDDIDASSNSADL